MVTATVSSKSQVVLPKHLLEGLGINRGDRVLIYSDEKEIRMKPLHGSILDVVAGSVKVPESKRGVPFERVLEVTKRKVAKKLAKK